MKKCQKTLFLSLIVGIFFVGTAFGDDANTLLDQPGKKMALLSLGLQVNDDGSISLQRNYDGSYQEYGVYVSEPLKMDEYFNSLMCSFVGDQNEDAGFDIYIRVSSDGYNWTSWMPARFEENSVLPFEAYYIQYKVELFTTDMTQSPSFSTFSAIYDNIPVHMMDILDEYQPFEFSQVKSAPKPPVVSREKWGAAAPGSYKAHTPKRIVLHHAWRPNISQYKGASTIKGIQRYHQVDNGWADIGYHFLIGPDGVIYQGRPETVVGAHCPPNVNWVGICMIGDFDPNMDKLPQVTRESLMDLMVWLSSYYKISPNELFGHRDFSTKTCPGEDIYRQHGAFKAEIAEALKALAN